MTRGLPFASPESEASRANMLNFFLFLTGATLGAVLTTAGAEALGADA